MTGLEAAPVVFVEVALAARAEGGMRDSGAARSWGVERWEEGTVVVFVGGVGGVGVVAEAAAGVVSLGASAVVAVEEVFSGTGAEVKIGVG